MQPALKCLVVYLAVDEGDLFVRAELVERVDLALAPDDYQRPAVQLDAQGALLGNLIDGAGPDEIGHNRPFSSSASIAAVTRSRTSGTLILPISSPKKPLITRRLASLSGMPLAIR